MVKEVKQKAVVAKSTTATILHNLDVLSLSISLLGVSLFAIWYAYSHEYETVNQKALLVGALLVLGRGLWSLGKFLANKE